MITIKQAIDNGAYLLMRIDHQKKYTSYSLVTDISESERIIHCELNKSAFLKAKNEMRLKVRVKPTVFLNYIPFAVVNKDSIPMMECLI